MFEELLPLSSSDDEEIEIIEERLNTVKQIQSPSKVKKLVEDLSKKGHLPVAAAVKVRSIQFFSGQGPLSLDEGEERRNFSVSLDCAVTRRPRS